MRGTEGTRGRTVTHPRFAPRRGAVRASTWWGRAWVRSVEESSYGEAELRAARTHARSGRVGALGVSAGSVVAAVDEGDDTWTTQVRVPLIGEQDRPLLAATVAQEAGRVAALLTGDLPHALVEELEEAGVELIPFGGELDSSCGCEAWMQPCAHALAVMYQLGWLLDADPFVLLAIRGVERDRLLADVHDQASATPATDPIEIDLEVALEAAREAAALLSEHEPAVEQGPTA